MQYNPFRPLRGPVAVVVVTGPAAVADAGEIKRQHGLIAEVVVARDRHSVSHRLFEHVAHGRLVVAAAVLEEPRGQHGVAAEHYRERKYADHFAGAPPPKP